MLRLYINNSWVVYQEGFNSPRNWTKKGLRIMDPFLIVQKVVRLSSFYLLYWLFILCISLSVMKIAMWQLCCTLSYLFPLSHSCIWLYVFIYMNTWVVWIWICMYMHIYKNQREYMNKILIVYSVIKYKNNISKTLYLRTLLFLA